MSLINKIKAIFEAEKVEAQTNTIFVKTKDGQIFLVKAPALALDVEIVLVDEAGVEQPILDGDYLLEDGSTVSVLAGKVAEISTAEVEMEAIPAGDYILEDGSTITVDENQVVIAYVKAVAPGAEAPTGASAQAMNAVNEELELKVAKLEAELKVSKEAFEKVNSQPAVKPVDKKKFEKTDKEVKTNTMLSKVTEIMNKNK